MPHSELKLFDISCEKREKQQIQKSNLTHNWVTFVSDRNYFMRQLHRIETFKKNYNNLSHKNIILLKSQYIILKNSKHLRNINHTS